VVVDFGSGVRVGGPSRTNNVLVVKYDSAGIPLWARTQIETTDDPNPNPEFAFHSLALDSFGNLYAAGSIEARSAIDFGNGVTIHGNGSFYGNVVLVKYSTAGVAQWARTQTEGENSAEYRGVVVAGSRVYAGGSMFGAAVGFGPGVSLPDVSANNTTALVLVAYDLDGAAQWARTQTGGTDNSTASINSLALGSDGLYVAGEVRGSVSLGLGNGITIDGLSIIQNLLIAKYGFEGSAQKGSSVVGGLGSTYYSALTVDRILNNPYAAGFATGTAPINPTDGTVIATEAVSGQHVLLVKY